MIRWSIFAGPVTYSIQDTTCKIPMDCGKFHMALNVMLLLSTGLEVNTNDIATGKMTFHTWNSAHSVHILELLHVYCVCGDFHFFGGFIINAYPITSDSHAPR